MAEQYERNIRNKAIEQSILESKVKQIHSQLNESNTNLNEMSEKVVNLTNQIQELTNENAQQIQINQKYQQMCNS